MNKQKETKCFDEAIECLRIANSRIEMLERSFAKHMLWIQQQRTRALHWIQQGLEELSK